MRPFCSSALVLRYLDCSNARVFSHASNRHAVSHTRFYAESGQNRTDTCHTRTDGSETLNM